MKLIGRLIFRLAEKFDRKEVDQREIDGVRLHLDGVSAVLDRLEKSGDPEIIRGCHESRDQVAMTRETLDRLEEELVPRKPN